MTPGPVAVLDVGSNSGRVVVYRREASGHLRIVATTRAALRLVREVDEGRRLGPEAIARALDALADFRAIAVGAGASRIVGVATAAVRDAVDGQVLVDRVRRELGFELRVIDGEEEGRLGFQGAVRGLPVDSGVLFDMGGGSMQVCRFRHRELVEARSLPLGALRLSRRFLEHDPPTPGDLRRLRRFVDETLEDAGVRPLRSSETLVGTGGTARNLAKVDRRSHEQYPITRVHGYALPRRRVAEVGARLARTRPSRRDKVPGLSDERGDSIVGGAAGVLSLMEALQADELVVSGQGVREGLAYEMFAGGGASPEAVREASLAALTARFAGWDEAAARRRAEAAAALADALLPRHHELGAALVRAARVLDVGRAMDFFDRHQHAAEAVLAAELDGFSHREVTLTAAVLASGGDEHEDLRRFAPLLRRDERELVEAAGCLLALADDLEERSAGEGEMHLACAVRPHEVAVSVPTLLGWRPRKIGPRFERVFEKALVVSA